MFISDDAANFMAKAIPGFYSKQYKDHLQGREVSLADHKGISAAAAIFENAELAQEWIDAVLAGIEGLGADPVGRVIPAGGDALVGDPLFVAVITAGDMETKHNIEVLNKMAEEIQ